MARLLRDARFAFRLFSKAPAFTSLAIVRARPRHLLDHRHLQRRLRHLLRAAAIPRPRGPGHGVVAVPRGARAGVGQGLRRLEARGDRVRRPQRVGRPERQHGHRRPAGKRPGGRRHAGLPRRCWATGTRSRSAAASSRRKASSAAIASSFSPIVSGAIGSAAIRRLWAGRFDSTTNPTRWSVCWARGRPIISRASSGCRWRSHRNSWRATAAR